MTCAETLDPETGRYFACPHWSRVSATAAAAAAVGLTGRSPIPPPATMFSTRRTRWRMATLLTSVSLLVIASCYLEDITNFVISSNSQPKACMDGVVTAQPGGRLGNLLMEYSCSAILANRHHLRLAMPSQILVPLSAIFHNLSAEPLHQVLQQPPCRELNLTEQEFLDNPNHTLLTWGAVEGRLRRLMARHLPLIFERYMMLPDLLAPSLEFLRHQFRFRPELQRVANEKLHKIKLETASATGTNYTEVCAVGVHVRRTDYIRFMRELFNLRQEVGISYYEAAATTMLAELRNECAAVAFAVTSDDNQWCQQNLFPTITRNASKHTPASMGFLMTSESPADDLCLLSSCQHTIMTYGTFGLSAAILSGGINIMYDSVQHGAREPSLPERMVPMVPGWLLVP